MKYTFHMEGRRESDDYTLTIEAETEDDARELAQEHDLDAWPQLIWVGE